MYIKTFKLKQHTPMIHFQSGENGATLRASEVKPKLDKFLINKLGKDNVKKEWKRRYENGEIALDYGMSFVAINYRKIKIENRHRNSPMYFGNMGDGEDKHLVFADGVEGKIKCKNEDLLEKLESKLPEFFFLHNFGTRQSKGYGSFTVDDSVFTPSLFKYSFTINSIRGFEDVMSNIGWFYQSLRSGFNLNIRGNEIYLKPAIFHYLSSKNITWDKKSIKEAYENNNTPKNRNNYKDLLGLSTSEKWGKDFTLTKEDVKKEVTRYKSPIFFKPIIDGSTATVYFDYFEPKYLQSFIGTEFKIKANGRGNLKMYIPNNFDFEDFLKFSCQLNMKEKIKGGNNGFPRVIKNSLTTIYSQLKSQTK